MAAYKVGKLVCRLCGISLVIYVARWARAFVSGRMEKFENESAIYEWKFIDFSLATTGLLFNHRLLLFYRFELRGLLSLWNTMLAMFSIMGAFRTAPELIHVLRNYGLFHSVCVPRWVRWFYLTIEFSDCDGITWFPSHQARAITNLTHTRRTIGWFRCELWNNRVAQLISNLFRKTFHVWKLRWKIPINVNGMNGFHCIKFESKIVFDTREPTRSIENEEKMPRRSRGRGLFGEINELLMQILFIAGSNRWQILRLTQQTIDKSFWVVLRERA